MRITERVFGRTADGTEVTLFTLISENGVEASVMTYGALLTSLKTPDRQGRTGEITLGFEDLQPYLGDHPYFGATIGRFANRIGDGRFTLDGKDYSLALNENGACHLHGGERGFDKVLWNGRAEASQVIFTYSSPNGEEGYPGAVEVRAIYRLSDDGVLTTEYVATSDAATPINLTNHTYWNLAGSGDVLSHTLTMSCSHYLPVNKKLVPTGEIRPVSADPAMDFTTPHTLGERIAQVSGGYDHCYVIDESSESPAPALVMEESQTGRRMEVRTTQPGVQLYTGNFLDGTITGRGGEVYRKHSGFCVETQAFPDAINRPEFPSCVLRPGERFNHKTEFAFTAV
jgi:aldose 1-epimerase